jgi:hypothetical protein
MSQVNLKRLRENALLDGDGVPGIAVPSSASVSTSLSGIPNANASAASLKSKASNLGMSTASIAQQEREFQRAVQPSSPISALLGAARQPLVIAQATNGGNASLGSGRDREQPLIRKLQAAAKESRSPGRPLAARNNAGLQDIVEEGDLEDEDEMQMQMQRRKELEAQKARIVAQMVPTTKGEGDAEEMGEVENVPPMPMAGGLGLKKQKSKDVGLGTRESDVLRRCSFLMELLHQARAWLH